MANENRNTTVIKLSSNDKGAVYPKIKANRGGWVNFGDKNDFPQELVKINRKSPVQGSILRSTVTYIIGKGAYDEDTKNSYIGAPNPDESWNAVLRKVARDYKEFGGFYMQIIKNKGSETVSVYHQDYTKVRIGEVDEDGKPTSFMISNDWSKTSGKNRPVELTAFTNIDSMKDGDAYMFWSWDYLPALDYYSLPDYYEAMQYIKADGTLGEFYNNSIDNGFTPSVVISMPSNPPANEKNDFQEEMEDAFSGAKGASSVIVLWGENTEVKPTITPFNASANADIYNNVEGIIFQKIISANRLTSPTLAGVSGSGNLSGNAAEIIDSYVLYNYTIIKTMREEILEKINKFQKINKRKDIVLADLDVVNAIRAKESEMPTEFTLTPKKRR